MIGPGMEHQSLCVYQQEVSTVLNTTSVCSKISVSVPCTADAAASLLEGTEPHLPVGTTLKGWWQELKSALWSQLKVNLVVMLIMFIAFWWMGPMPGKKFQDCIFFTLS
jgi:hypothetical protein